LINHSRGRQAHCKIFLCQRQSRFSHIDLNLIAFESNQQMYAHTYSSQKQTSMQKTHSYLFLLVFVCVCQARVSASRAGHNSTREQVCGPASVTGSLNLCECVCVFVLHLLFLEVILIRSLCWPHSICLYYIWAQEKGNRPHCGCLLTPPFLRGNKWGVEYLQTHTSELFPPFGLADIIALRVWGTALELLREYGVTQGQDHGSVTHTHTHTHTGFSSGSGR